MEMMCKNQIEGQETPVRIEDTISEILKECVYPAHMINNSDSLIPEFNTEATTLLQNLD